MYGAEVADEFDETITHIIFDREYVFHFHFVLRELMIISLSLSLL